MEKFRAQMSEGRLSEYLVRKGVLSETMLKQLQSEFLGEKSAHTNFSKQTKSVVDSKNSSRPKITAKRTKKRK